MNNAYNLYNQYNLPHLEAIFSQYLLSSKVSEVTIKNYLSDLRFFLWWLISKFKIQGTNNVDESNFFSIIKLISAIIVTDYKNFLVGNKIPDKTINRRLSTLRKFCSFCIFQGWLKENPAKQIQNSKGKIQNDNSKDEIELILDQYGNSLSKDGTDFKDVNNYLDDIREFLTL